MTLYQLLDKIGDLDEKSILELAFASRNFLIREVSLVFSLVFWFFLGSVPGFSWFFWFFS